MRENRAGGAALIDRLCGKCGRISAAFSLLEITPSPETSVGYGESKPDPERDNPGAIGGRSVVGAYRDHLGRSMVLSQAGGD